MERSTRGHRHHPRAGSVTVAELMERVSHPTHTSPAGTGRTTPPHREAPAPGDVVDSPEESDAPCGPRPACVAIATMAILLLFGSVAAVATVTEARPAPPPEPGLSRMHEIAGAAVFRPDLLDQQLGHPGTPTGFTGTAQHSTTEQPDGSSPVEPSGTTEQTGVTGPGTGPTPYGTDVATTSNEPTAPTTLTSGEQSATVTSVPTTTGGENPLDVVRLFYDLLDEQPAKALELLDRALRDADPTGFVTSWQSVRQVRIEDVQALPDGSVLVTALLERIDRSPLRVRQLVFVSTNRPWRIIDARLLSAQES